MKTPANISIEELAVSADRASEAADREAREAGIAVAGIEKAQPKRKAAPAAQQGDKRRSGAA